MLFYVGYRIMATLLNFMLYAFYWPFGNCYMQVIHVHGAKFTQNRNIHYFCSGSGSPFLTSGYIISVVEVEVPFSPLATTLHLPAPPRTDSELEVSRHSSD